MENFFRPRRLSTHTSLVTQFLTPRSSSRSIHQRLFEQAALTERAKDVREHVASKAHRSSEVRVSQQYMDPVRQRRREHWESASSKDLRSAPAVSSKSKELAYLRRFQGERVHCVNPLGGRSIYLQKTPRPVSTLEIEHLEEKYGLDLLRQPRLGQTEPAPIATKRLSTPKSPTKLRVSMCSTASAKSFVPSSCSRTRKTKPVSLFSARTGSPSKAKT